MKRQLKKKLVWQASPLVMQGHPTRWMVFGAENVPCMLVISSIEVVFKTPGDARKASAYRKQIVTTGNFLKTL